MNADTQEGYEAEVVEAAAVVLKILADPTRLKILLALDRSGELSVNELAEATGKKPAGVSQHLAKLRLTSMVQSRHSGTTVFYSLTDEHAIALALEAIKQAEHTLSPQPLPQNHRHHQPATERPQA